MAILEASFLCSPKKTAMKAFLLFPCLLLLLSLSLPAQIVDRSLSFGFVAAPHVVRAMDEGKWLVVGRGLPYRGDLFSDSVFAVIFDQQGEVLLRQTPALPIAEIYHVYDAWPLADGGFMVSIGSGGCDVGGAFEVIVQKYASDGQLIWTLQGSNEQGNKPPTVWRIAPDGNLLGLEYNELWKVDAATGLVIWQAELFNPIGNELPYYFDLLPGTEDFLGIATSNFQIWKKMAAPAGPAYVLQNTLPLDGHWQGLGFAPNGWYYALNRVSDEVERFDQDLSHALLATSDDLEGLIQMAAVDDGLYLLGRHYGQNWLRKTDFLGQNPVELPMPDRWLSGYALAVRGDSVAVAGTDGSGPKSMPGNTGYAEFQAEQLWLRTFHGLAPTPSADTINASVTNLQQLSGVDTMSFGSWFPYFSLHGGDFQVQITNRSNTTLEQVYVNFSYEENRSNICFSTPARQRLYTGLQLAPGESTWVTFGDLGVQAQSGLANEFCFWTSAPNGRPDAQHEDDHYCLPATYTVDITTPSTQSVELLPNPAHDYFRVINVAGAADAEWQLHDATGRLVQRGIYPAGQPELSISTEQMPHGFYVFRMSDYIGKLVKN